MPSNHNPRKSNLRWTSIKVINNHRLFHLYWYSSNCLYWTHTPGHTRISFTDVIGAFVQVSCNQMEIPHYNPALAISLWLALYLITSKLCKPRCTFQASKHKPVVRVGYTFKRSKASNLGCLGLTLQLLPRHQITSQCSLFSFVLYVISFLDIYSITTICLSFFHIISLKIHIN